MFAIVATPQMGTMYEVSATMCHLESHGTSKILFCKMGRSHGHGHGFVVLENGLIGGPHFSPGLRGVGEIHGRSSLAASLSLDLAQEGHLLRLGSGDGSIFRFISLFYFIFVGLVSNPCLVTSCNNLLWVQLSS